jgi:hypothetical protein
MSLASRLRRAFPAAAAAVASFLLVSFAHAEKEPSARDLLGARVEGSNYRVLPKVSGDGRNRVWTVESRYGVFTVTGDALLVTRLGELDVLARLEETSFGASMFESLGRSVTAPLVFGGELVTKPVDTVKGTIGGIGQMFDRMTASEKGSSKESLAGGLFGIDSARRRIAAELDVDPHTDFKPLADRLTHLAQGSALGSFSVGAAMKIAVPGTLAVSFSGITASKGVKDALREKTSGQLIRDARATLEALGVSEEAADRFIKNPHYTPTDLFVTTAALQRLSARGTDVFVEAASGARSRSSAFLYRLQADMMAARAKALKGPLDFLPAPGITLVKSGDGRIIAFVPADEFLWNEENAKAADEVGRWLAKHEPSATRIAVFAGPPGERARRELAARRWTIERIALGGVVQDRAATVSAPASSAVPLPPLR